MSWQAAATSHFALQWLTDSEAGLVIGVLGLAGTFFGFFLSYRAEKKVAENLSAERERIIRGVANVVLARQPIPTSAAKAPNDGGSAKPAEDPRPTQSSPPDPPVKTSAIAKDLQAQPGEYVGTVDVNGDGDPDLLVETIQRGGSNLKVFSWQEFDLVLVAEFQNKTGAHFHPRGNSSIATLDWVDGRLVERTFTWHRGKFCENINSNPTNLDAFPERPEWSM